MAKFALGLVLMVVLLQGVVSYHHRFRGGDEILSRKTTATDKETKIAADCKKGSYMTRRHTGTRMCGSLGSFELTTEEGCNDLNLELGGSFFGDGSKNTKAKLSVDYDFTKKNNNERRTVFYEFKNARKKADAKKGYCFNANTAMNFGDIKHSDMDPKYMPGDYSQMSYIWKVYYYDDEYYVTMCDKDNQILSREFMSCTPGGKTPKACLFHGQIVYDEKATALKTCAFAGEKIIMNIETGPKKMDPKTRECAYLEDIPKGEKDNLDKIINGKAGYEALVWNAQYEYTWEGGADSVKKAKAFHDMHPPKFPTVELATPELVDARFLQKLPIPEETPEPTCRNQLEFRHGRCYNFKQWHATGKLSQDDLLYWPLDCKCDGMPAVPKGLEKKIKEAET